MTWVKVCGLRRASDIAVATAAGADAIGLVLADSPRRVEPDLARRLAAGSELPVYLVLVGARPSEALDLAGYIGAAGIQPHGERAAHTAAAAVKAGLAVLRPVRVGPMLLGPEGVAGEVPSDQIPLLDRHHPDLEGGTGLRIDPEWIPDMDREWVLAGGLGPDNIREAVMALHPWGVDASSGLESSPGTKDPALIEAFVERAKKT